MKVDYRWEVGQLDHLEEDLEARGDKYEVTFILTIIATSPEKAEQLASDVIEAGILKLIDEEDREPVYEYSIEDVCPASL